MSSIGSIAPPWPLVRTYTKTCSCSDSRSHQSVRLYPSGQAYVLQGGILRSNPTTPKLFPKVFVARRRLLRNAPSKGHHSRYITLFFKGTYSVIGFFEVMRMFLVSLMHFLR